MSDTLGPIDELLQREASEFPATGIALIDAPGLVPWAVTACDDVRVWCDDWREAAAVPAELLVAHPAELAGVNLALGHAPKSLAALDEQCASVQTEGDVMFLTAARDRHLNRSMNEVLARYFTGVNASLGHRKCRALRGFGPTGRPTEWPKARRHDDLGLIVAAHGATFAGTKVDAGTRLLLRQLDVAGTDVLDLGSGNGVIAAWLAKAGHQVWARDVSWSAVAATQTTAELNELAIEASWGDGLDGYPDASLDAIVTNPPFHRGVAKESADTLAWFAEATRVLRPGGELWCVFNSHLPWRRELTFRLGDTTLVAQDPRYTVTRTVRRDD